MRIWLDPKLNNKKSASPDVISQIKVQNNQISGQWAACDRRQTSN
ncbi:hypothetical protein ACNKHL_21640 [Shigella flexneri]